MAPTQLLMPLWYLQPCLCHSSTLQAPWKIHNLLALPMGRLMMEDRPQSRRGQKGILGFHLIRPEFGLIFQVSICRTRWYNLFTGTTYLLNFHKFKKIQLYIGSRTRGGNDAEHGKERNESDNVQREIQKIGVIHISEAGAAGRNMSDIPNEYPELFLL